ncbi:NAD(P)-binding protein [Ramaria rubella]|nr:NAD(P)-binding protein [Ramaria rubella]
MQSRTVLITGCSAGGIGFHLAKEYHAKGQRVFATARQLSAMEELRELGIECLELDVTDIGLIKKVRDEISQLTGGSLDILVNNAGRSHPIPFTDVDIGEVKAMFEINVFGVMMMVQEFVHLLIASGDGRIVNIGSVSAIIPQAFGAPYAAAKGALHAYGNTLRVELEPFNVKIITGGVKSNIAAPQHRRALPAGSLQPINDDYVNKRQNRS